MNASLLLAVAVLSSVFSSNVGVPLVNRRQTNPEDEPLCPERRAVKRNEFSNGDDGSVCLDTCRLPRSSYVGIPFGPIVVVDTYQCCSGYTQQDSTVQGSNFVCVNVSTQTTQPPSTTATTATTPTTVTTATTPTTQPSVRLCPSTGPLPQQLYTDQSNVCPQDCLFQIPVLRISFPLKSYECCDGFIGIEQENRVVCVEEGFIITSPPSTEATTSTPRATSSTGATASAVATSSTGSTSSTGATASSETTVEVATEPTGERCTDEDRTLSTYVNVEPNSLCPVECYTQLSAFGIPYGPKNVQTRYQCCPGYKAERAYPNHPTNFNYQCLEV